MSKNSDSDEKSDNEMSGSSESDDDSDQGAPSVPEINFQPQLSPFSASQSKPDEDFRSKHPLFDAPERIDDHDELNAQEKLSSDDDADNNDDDNQEQNQENSSIIIDANDNNNNDNNFVEDHGKPSSVLAMDHENHNFIHSNLIPQDSNANESDEISMWRKFSLPPTPDPDDTEIDAAIQDQFSISKLLQQIRTT
ncbi:hypothetical protein M9Y10_034089 [Tritrichomonas musculus]|uniref:Uncharacterized protein n=1 Tax=Tritrichomonas musculus TaxID=1915356 RepID=A0ABR2KDZ1_9EUKA